ncbi:MAG: hypothetical protein V2A54_18405 [Bacteroidota bacterium]
MKFSKKITDYLFTFGTEGIVMIAGLLVYRLAANQFGDLGFSEYSLARRAISLIQPVLILGMGVGIPRYIAFSRAEGNIEKSNTYFLSGFLLLNLFSLLLLIFLVVFREMAAFWLFGDVQYTYMIIPIAVMLLGASLHASAYSYFRGTVRMKIANLFQLINLGIVPVVSLLAGNSIQEIFYYNGAAWCIVSIVFLTIIFTGIRFEKLFFKSNARELLIYGIQRVPGDFALSLFLAAPAFLVVHMSGITIGGYVAFGISVVGIIGSAFSPISLILLPEASRMIAEKNFTALRREVKLLLLWTVLCNVVFVIIFCLFASTIISIYLGEAFPELVRICVVLIISSLGYSVFVVLRSVIDAYYKFAMNTRNILIAFVIFIAFAGIVIYNDFGYTNLLITFVFSMIVLGLLSLADVVRILTKNR